jgi:4-aminobutyrate aminotransferase-like enzyme
MDFGQQLPQVRVAPPGPESRALAERLRAVESRNVTWLGDAFPAFWREARGANVRDVDGNVYLDLTAAFGVSLAGHAEPAVTAAIDAQGTRLVHGMGDVHPSEAKVLLLERLAALMPWPDSRAVLASAGSEAVEIALKTALLATGRGGVVAFRGGYHGLTMGALAATARSEFRTPFAARLYDGVAHLPFPHDGAEVVGTDTATPADVLERLEQVMARGAPNGDPVGAIIVEPVQARGGVRVLSEAFGRAVGQLVRRHGVLVIADEVFTGLGRCGAVLASPRVGLDPDLVCLGKVLGGGLPLSACVGPARVMDAWPPSPGEALHTSTFLGHPLACAAGVAVLEQVADGLPARAEALGVRLQGALGAALVGLPGVGPVRGLGLLLGVPFVDPDGAPREGAAVRAAERALALGVLALPAGNPGDVLELTPPVCLTPAQEAAAVALVTRAVEETTSAGAGR